MLLAMFRRKPTGAGIVPDLPDGLFPTCVPRACKMAADGWPDAVASDG